MNKRTHFSPGDGGSIVPQDLRLNGMSVHGIHTEESDVRAHVCASARKIYVFPTEEGIKAVRNRRCRCIPAHQRGVDGPTAWGYNIDPKHIRRLLEISPREVTWQAIGFREGDGPGVKGDKAVTLVSGMLRRGLFPLPIEGSARADVDLDIRGTDIIVAQGSGGRIHIQVKCDFNGGRKSAGFYGLYLQIAERNPLQIH